MERVHRASVLFIAAISVAWVHSLGAAHGAESSPPSLQGAWRAVSMVQNEERAEPSQVNKLLLIILDNKITMRLGPKLIAETSYTLDTKAKPATIDMMFEGQATLGIFEQTGDKLRICLNEQGKGRPKAIPATLGKDCDVDLSLSRADGNWSRIHLLDADGGNPRLLVKHPDFVQQGSPAWSVDGSKIALDACRPLLGETWSMSHVLICQADGTGLKDLGPGAMPSWSPDGKRITFSSYENPRGVMIMNADGSGREVLDQEGWGAEWCPNANKIAYTKYISGDGGNAYTANGFRASLRVHDLTAKTSQTLVDKEGYRQIYWGLAWSPDGRWIAFKGVTPENKCQLVVVSTDGQKQDLRVLAAEGKEGLLGIMDNVSWSPDSKQVLAGLRFSNNPPSPHQLSLVHIDGKAPPKALPKQPKNQSCVGMAWSPDGKHILVAKRPNGL